MNPLLKNWRVMLLVVLLLGSLTAIGMKGLRFGIDFKGGTLFQVHLGEEVKSSEEMDRIVRTISQRLDWTGLKDTTVKSWGKEFIVVQIAESNPDTIARIESLLKRQGKFEVMLDGNLVFTGEDIIEISRDPSKGYGLRKAENLVSWILPFKLKHEAAQRFTEMTFHKCTVIAYDPQIGSQYECEKTYFFIDRPSNAVLVFPQSIYAFDEQLFLQGNYLENIPQDTRIDEVLSNAAVPYVIYNDKNVSDEVLAELQELVKEHKFAIVPKSISLEMKQKLVAFGFELKEIEEEEEIPWTWIATGARQIISLSEDVTNMDVASLSEAKIMSDLLIRGYGSSIEDAQERLNDLTVLLESGSLSVPVESISKDTISPLLGENFLFNAALIGLVSLAIVSIVLFVRYRVLKLIVPMMITGLSEVILILGFASLISWNLDLAAVAGILAAVGTGVDDQIIITDELVRGEVQAETSLINRIKRAFFIIMAAAATTIATMAPIVLFGFGLGKLVGFAITTIVGVLIGVSITRPAYSEIAKNILAHSP